MYRLTPEKRTAVIKALVEGNSVRATCRLTGAAKGTVLRLLAEIGEVCIDLHDERIRNIRAKRIQMDEIWSFVGQKGRKASPEAKAEGKGDAWTWVAMDQDSKLAVSWLVGPRNAICADQICRDLASRLATRVQLTTDGLVWYRGAIERAFGWNGCDYAQLEKAYANLGSKRPEARYSPGIVTAIKKQWVMGKPREADVCTSHVERQNLTMRMQMRRFTRLTNAFSKKLQNHVYAVALHFAVYNFCKAHGTLTKRNRGIHTSPAMAAGLTNRVWDVADLVSLLVAREAEAS